MSGITISITLPKPLEHVLNKRARIAGMSRSRFIGNILHKWEDSLSKKNESMTELSKTENLNSVPNDCPNRENDGFCSVFDQICNTNQAGANTCVGYPKDENRGK